MNCRGRGVHVFILPFRYDDDPGLTPRKVKVVMKILASVNILAYPLSRFPCM